MIVILSLDVKIILLIFSKYLFPFYPFLIFDHLMAVQGYSYHYLDLKSRVYYIKLSFSYRFFVDIVAVNLFSFLEINHSQELALPTIKVIISLLLLQCLFH